MMCSRDGVDSMTTPRDVAGHGWPEVIRALAHRRVGAATVDGLLSGSGLTAASPQLTMALTESSHATHHALVRLAEARELLASDHRGCPRVTTA